MYCSLKESCMEAITIIRELYTRNHYIVTASYVQKIGSELFLLSSYDKCIKSTFLEQ